MQSVRVDELKPGVRPDGSLYHPSGFLMLQRGQRWDRLTQHAASEAGIKELWLCKTERDVSLLRSSKMPGEKKISDLREGEVLKHDIFDGDGRRLLEKGRMILKHHVESFRERGIETVHEARESDRQVLEAYGSALAQGVAGVSPSDDEILRLKPRRNRSSEGPQPKLSGWPKEEVFQAYMNHMVLLTGVRDIYSAPVPDARACISLAGEVIAWVIRRPALTSSYALAVTSLDEYQADHALGCCILAAGVARRAGFSTWDAVEIAAAALLHDIGMRSIAEEIVRKPEPLEPSEHTEVERHATAGAETLAKVGGFGSIVCLTAAQHHERQDGSGYPAGKKEDEIADCSRIAAVCDVFQAMVSDRHHRPGFLPHDAMTTVLAMAKEGKMDSQAARMLCETIGLYPIGSCVELSGGEIARVIGVSLAGAKSPVVSIVSKDGEVSTEYNAFDLADTEDASVKVAAHAPEVELPLGTGFRAG